jgi:hypothetical protein
MIISDEKTIKEVQLDFHKHFPGLKVEFYHSHHQEGEGSPIKEQINQNELLKSARKVHTEGDFVIDEEMSVGQFEQVFYEQFGLNIQVFRKSGSLWLQTTSTDDWSLADQNRKGTSSERHYKDKYE